jgi:hypothetical protein
MLHQTLAKGAEMVSETSVIFNQLTRLKAREYFIKDLKVFISNCSIVNPDSYHPSLVLDCKLTFVYPHISPTPHRNYAKGVFFLLHSTN